MRKRTTAPMVFTALPVSMGEEVFRAIVNPWGGTPQNGRHFTQHQDLKGWSGRICVDEGNLLCPLLLRVGEQQGVFLEDVPGEVLLGPLWPQEPGTPIVFRVGSSYPRAQRAHDVAEKIVAWATQPAFWVKGVLLGGKAHTGDPYVKEWSLRVKSGQDARFALIVFWSGGTRMILSRAPQAKLLAGLKRLVKCENPGISLKIIDGLYMR
jgi:hypothetical protein